MEIKHKILLIYILILSNLFSTGISYKDYIKKIVEKNIKSYTNIIDKDIVLALIYIESSGRRRIINPKTKAVGLMQITEICLMDYNRINKTKYKYKDLYRTYVNIKVGMWYLNKCFIKLNITKYDFEYNENILILTKKKSKHNNIKYSAYINNNLNKALFIYNYGINTKRKHFFTTYDDRIIKKFIEIKLQSKFKLKYLNQYVKDFNVKIENKKENDSNFNYIISNIGIIRKFNIKII